MAQENKRQAQVLKRLPIATTDQPWKQQPRNAPDLLLGGLYGNVYMIDAEMKKWEVLPPLPKPNSHIKCSWVVVNNSTIITGGTTEKHPANKRMILVEEVFQLHLDSLTWSVIGKLPYYVKSTLAGFWDGYCILHRDSKTGQYNRHPRKVIGEKWRTKLNF